MYYGQDVVNAIIIAAIVAAVTAISIGFVLGAWIF